MNPFQWIACAILGWAVAMFIAACQPANMKYTIEQQRKPDAVSETQGTSDNGS